jgi:hypothetical protein
LLRHRPGAHPTAQGTALRALVLASDWNNLLSSTYNIQGRGLWLLPGPSLCPLNSQASENRGPM